jgi:hypothetical protein
LGQASGGLFPGIPARPERMDIPSDSLGYVAGDAVRYAFAAYHEVHMLRRDSALGGQLGLCVAGFDDLGLDIGVMHSKNRQKIRPFEV